MPCTTTNIWLETFENENKAPVILKNKERNSQRVGEMVTEILDGPKVSTRRHRGAGPSRREEDGAQQVVEDKEELVSVPWSWSKDVK